MTSLVALLVLAAGAAARTDAVPVEPPVPQAVAKGVWMIPGGLRPDRQPDGNSVVFEAPAGLVVVDTGRHSWHREAILALARAQQQPVVAVVNTHWHLDHVSGNAALRAAQPGLRVYASDAIDGALAGFLPKSAKDSEPYLDDPGIPETMREDIRSDLDTIRHGDALKPDVIVGRSGAMNLGGRTLQFHRVEDAVTAGDLWLYDESTRVAVLGDLVTVPAPFLDTACPEGWKAALDEVAAVPFDVAIPGHGAPMTRAGFELYRRSFGAFLECAKSERTARECATQWSDSVGSLLEGGDRAKARAGGMAEYYVGMLRANGGRSRYCEAVPL